MMTMKNNNYKTILQTTWRHPCHGFPHITFTMEGEIIGLAEVAVVRVARP